MSDSPFHEVYTLSDAVELIGRRLYSDTWTGVEYQQQKRLSPTELGALREPLEIQMAAATDEVKAIHAAMRRSLDKGEIESLRAREEIAQARWRECSSQLNFHLPELNDHYRNAYEGYARWKASEEVLLKAIRGFQIQVHDGRGRQLNSSVWAHLHFHYSIELSAVKNSKISGEPRRQAARIDRQALLNWLDQLEPIVKPRHLPTPEEQLREYLKQQVKAAEIAPRKTKSDHRDDVSRRIPGISKRKFEQVWAEVVPKEWQLPGAPKKNNHPAEQAEWDKSIKGTESIGKLSYRKIVPATEK
jgi:hypothetical protein